MKKLVNIINCFYIWLKCLFTNTCPNCKGEGEVCKKLSDRLGDYMDLPCDRCLGSCKFFNLWKYF